MNITITNTTSIEINEKIIKNISQFVIEKELGKDDEYYLEIIFISDDHMKQLNSEYRKIDASTDVLTFVYDKPMLGEIYISLDTIKRQAANYKNTFEGELIYILIHGLLHICGYNHKKDDTSNEFMFQLQRKYFNQLSKKYNL